MAASTSNLARKPSTPFGAMAAVARRASQHNEVVTFPTDRWRNDPVLFAKEVLGTTLWSKQVEILNSIRDHRNTSVRGAHKTGKTETIACAALWFYSTFPRARVVLSATTAHQVNIVIWAAVQRLFRQSQRGRYPLDGVIFDVARSGLRHEDGRQIIGITARDGESLQGISSPNALVIVDEASGVKDRFFEVLDSTLASSGGTTRKILTSNPTRTTGIFYDSHHSDSHLYNCIAVSGLETPNARGTGEIPGLAGPAWLSEKLEQYGPDSHQYAVRVLGEFCHDRDGHIVSNDTIAEAQTRWDEVPDEGDLQLGIDPAGDGVGGDESAIAVRRGKKIVTIFGRAGMSEDAVVVHALGFLSQYRRRGDHPRILVDAEGGIGTRVHAKLFAYLETRPNDFRLVSIRSGKIAFGDAEFHLVRDQLWGQCAKWLRDGGAIPEDFKLAQDLHAPKFVADDKRRYRATEKKELRKLLGRSPDRGDACALAIFGYAGVENASDEPNYEAELTPRQRALRGSHDDDSPSHYGAVNPYGGAVNPYGGG